MNKYELVSVIAANTGLTKAAAARAVDATTHAITNTLKKGEAITLVGFGTFKLTHRAARTARNPRTGEEVNIAARKAPSFSAGKTLKLAVNLN